MNQTIETIAREHVPEVGRERLSFLKFNTAGSPSRNRPKVLFFCFVGDAAEPSFCLKTVRSARDNSTLLESFQNLRELNRLAPEPAIFPRAIWAGEIDAIAWSIESSAPGAPARHSEAPRVLETYVEFQKKAALAARSTPARAQWEALADELGMSSRERASLFSAAGDPDEKAEITLMPQHGDLTLDNALVGRSVTLIDCDWFMPEGIAGFDLFHFLKRVPRMRERIPSYLESYRRAIGRAHPFGAADVLAWYLQEFALKLRQGSRVKREDLAAGFQELQANFPIA